MNHYLIIVTPFIAASIAQSLKIVLNSKNPFKLKELFKFSYAGMPSGHGAFVASLVTMLALTEGVFSPIFGVALAFAILTVNDALRLRQYLGQQGAVMNILIRDLTDDQFLDEKYPLLKERIGHTLSEVSVGLFLGTIIALALFFSIN